MIRSLFDVENMPEDESEISSKETAKGSVLTKGEDTSKELADENVVEKPLAENIVEKTVSQNVVEKKIEPDNIEKQRIRQIPAEEIISRANAKQLEIAETPVSQEPTSEIETPKVSNETPSEDTFAELNEAAKMIEDEDRFENQRNPEIFIPVDELADLEDSKTKRLESELAAIENELLEEKKIEEITKAEIKVQAKRKSTVINSIFDDEEISSSKVNDAETSFSTTDTKDTDFVISENKPFQAEDEPETKLETFRQSGLAYSAGIILLGAVVFMMIIGWGADLLFGTSPWGIVVGIVLGSIIGFVQFFRVTSQIFKK